MCFFSHVFWCLQSHLHDMFWKYFHFPADKEACLSDCFRSPRLRRRRKRRRNPRAMTATERLVLPWTGRWEAAGVKVSVDFEKNYVKVRTEWAEMFGKYRLRRKVSIDKEEKEYVNVLTGKRNVWRFCGGVFSVCYFKSCSRIV